MCNRIINLVGSMKKKSNPPHSTAGKLQKSSKKTTRSKLTGLLVDSQQEYEGSGMGLTIVAKAVERMGGHVGVESAIGHASKFWMDLPAACT